MTLSPASIICVVLSPHASLRSVSGFGHRSRLSALQRGRFAALPERLRRLCKPTSCGSVSSPAVRAGRRLGHIHICLSRSSRMRGATVQCDYHAAVQKSHQPAWIIYEQRKHPAMWSVV